MVRRRRKDPAAPVAGVVERAGSMASLTPLRLPGTGPGVIGIAIMLAVIGVLELLSRTSLPVPAPAAVLMLAVGYTAYRGGIRVGLVCAALAAIYEVYLFLVSGTVLPDASSPLWRAIAVAVSAVVIALMVGRLRLRLDALLREERVVRHSAEEGRRELAGALERMARAQGEVRFQARLLNTVGEAVVATDTAGHITYWNDAAQRLLGWSGDEALGMSVDEVLPPPDDSLEGGMGREGATVVQREVDARRKEGGTLPVLTTHATLQDDAGRLVGTVQIAVDLTPRKRAEEAQRLLADAGAVLSASLDYASTIRSLTRLVVPTFADACAVDLLEEGGLLRRLEASHHDPEREEAVRAVRTRYPLALDADHPIAEVLRTGHARLLADVSDAMLERIAQDSQHLRLLRELDYRSAIIVPLRASGRSLGALSLFLAGPGRRYDERDLELAREIARRTATAIDHARLYEAALLANQVKSDFLAVMSHELRTPLTTIMGYTDLMMSGLPEPVPEKALGYLQRVRAAAWHLLGLIEQILIYARLEVGREELHPERASAGDLIRDAASLIEPVAAEKGLAFHVIAPEHSPEIHTDITKARQILVNLLANAVKFTESGEVSIEVQDTGTDVTFVVHDTGIGIGPEHLEKVFDAFWQADQSATRSAGGTGLGLSVSRRLARLLGGDVAVTSEPGEGATFFVRLPRTWLSLDRSAAEPHSPWSPAPAELDRERAHIERG